MRVKFGTQAFDYVPESYLWPQERRKLEPVFSKYPQWIIKPPASARGIGIRVITKFSSLPKTKEKICCKYINKPYLINSRKFDLRLYVLVSSFDPLRIYLFNDGVARFAAQDFKHGASKSSEKFMHLTNFSISKKFESTASESNPKFASGSKYSMDGNKWSLKIFEEYMAEQGIDYAPIREKIHSMIIKSIMSVQSHNVDGLGNMQNRSNAYELFGFDVLLDANLKPWLMEVNISPSLKASCQADLKVKQRLVIDMFNLIGLKTEDLDLAFKMQKKGYVFINIDSNGQSLDYKKNPGKSNEMYTSSEWGF